MQIYIHRDKEDFGPYTQEAVMEYLKQGVFRETDYACYAGMSKWKTIKDLLGNAAEAEKARGAKTNKSTGLTGSKMIMGSDGEAKKKGGMIALNLLLVAIVIIAAYLKFGNGSEKLHRMFAGIEPVAAATPEETPVAGTPSPVADTPPPANPTPAPRKAFIIADLPARPDLWPKTVRLTQPASFPAVFNGQTVGSISIPTGTIVAVLKVESGVVDLDYKGGRQAVPWTATDLASQVAKVSASVPDSMSP